MPVAPGRVALAKALLEPRQGRNQGALGINRAGRRSRRCIYFQVLSFTDQQPCGTRAGVLDSRGDRMAEPQRGRPVPFRVLGSPSNRELAVRTQSP